MAEHDEHDHDREAIMARRRRFIALALGGLSTSCTPGKPHLDPTPVSTSGGPDSTTSDETGDSNDESGTETSPQACLKYDLPKEKLDVGSEPESESGSDSETGTPPRPCLVPIGLR
jgi:hypothetical protein